MADPITLAILFGAGALAGFAGKREVIEQSVDRDIVIRPLFQWNSGWLAHSLLSPEALEAVGSMLDLDLMSFWPGAKSGFFKVVAITQIGGPPDSHILAVLEGHGKYGWSLSEAYHRGYRRVQTRSQYQLISELIDQLNTDPAKEVVRLAQGLPPVERFAYLRRALTANPVLSAILAEDMGFRDLVYVTVELPEVQAVKDQITAQQDAVIDQITAQRSELREQRLAGTASLALPADLPAEINIVPSAEDIIEHYPTVQPIVQNQIFKDLVLTRILLSRLDDYLSKGHMPIDVEKSHRTDNLSRFLVDGLQNPSTSNLISSQMAKWAGKNSLPSAVFTSSEVRNALISYKTIYDPELAASMRRRHQSRKRH